MSVSEVIQITTETAEQIVLELASSSFVLGEHEVIQLEVGDAEVLNVEIGVPGPGVAAGGTTGQVLKKKSDDDYDTEWANADAAANGIPAGGAVDQMLYKKSVADYDAEWRDAPAGGSGEANTASSAGSGASLFYQKDGVDLQLNAIKSENDRLSIALDDVTHDIELTLVEGNIDHDQLANYVAAQHRIINDAGAGVTELWSASKISTELAAKANASLLGNYFHKTVDDTDDINEGETNKFASTENVDDAGAVMTTDETLAGNSFFLDEDEMTSNSSTKAPSQQSVKAYVDTELTSAIAGLIDSAPGALDTLNELAAALGDDPNFATTINTLLGLKANSSDVPAKSLWDAHSIVKADVDNNPAALVVQEQRLVGRITAGEITGLTAAEVKALLAIAWADVNKTTSSLADLATRQHSDLTDKGTNTHAQIDTHLGDDTKHRLINDSGTGATELWSASKINTELGTKIGSSGVTFEALNTNSDVGTGSAQVAQGNHNHASVPFGVTIEIDGGGSAIPTGTVIPIKWPWAGAISGWYTVDGEWLSSSISLDVRYAASGTKPVDTTHDKGIASLSSATEGSGSFTSFSVAAGGNLWLVVTGTPTCKLLGLTLTGTRTVG